MTEEPYKRKIIPPSREVIEYAKKQIIKKWNEAIKKRKLKKQGKSE